MSAKTDKPPKPAKPAKAVKAVKAAKEPKPNPKPKHMLKASHFTSVGEGDEENA